MALIAPLNDTQCLALLHEEAERYAQLATVRTLASQFRSVREVVEYIRQLRQRDDLGNLDDGPRLACNIPQRLRFAPSDPNCFERTAMFLALAEILDPSKVRTSASLVMDRGWHTFPVEMRNGLPEVVVLDPITPARNAMLSTAYKGRNITPCADKHIAPWFHAMARNACLEHGEYERYQAAMDSLRNALLTGEPIEDLDDVVYVLEVTGEDAEMWGSHGLAAHDRVYGSIRNLSFKLDKDLISGIVRKAVKTGGKIAPSALKAILVAKLGPVAQVALEGVDLAVENAAGNSKPKADTVIEAAKPSEPAKPKTANVGTLQVRLQGSPTIITTSPSSSGRRSPRDLLRRMSLAFR